jgi:uncharacterized protein (TIGR03067 family)
MDMEALQGKWQLVSWQFEGENLAREVECDPRSVVFSDNTAIFRLVLFVTQKRVFEAREDFQLDPLKKPRAIDFSWKDSAGKPVKQLGIYEIKNKRLKLCLPRLGDARPTGFESNEENKWSVYVYERMK